MIDWTLKLIGDWNAPLALLLYWLPLIVCFYGYSIRTWRNYQKDVAARGDSSQSYWPTDTVGDLLGRILLTIIPVINLIAAVFDVAPGLFRSFFEWIAGVFDQPLVPKRKDKR